MAGALACTHAALPLANARRALGAPVSCLCRSLQLRTLELRPQKSRLSSAQRPRQRQSICRFCFIGSFKQILVSIPKDSRVLPMPSFVLTVPCSGPGLKAPRGGGARARSHQTGARRVRTRVTCGCASDMSPPHAAQPGYGAESPRRVYCCTLHHSSIIIISQVGGCLEGNNRRKHVVGVCTILATPFSSRASACTCE